MRALLLLLLTTTTVNAAFVARDTDPSGGWECAVVRVVPPDHDRNPGYKVLLNIIHNDSGGVASFDVQHVLADGQFKDRSEQYSNATLLYNKNIISWSGQRSRNVMTGTFNPFGRPSYVEVITRNGHVETRIETLCHRNEGD